MWQKFREYSAELQVAFTADGRELWKQMKVVFSKIFIIWRDTFLPSVGNTCWHLEEYCTCWFQDFYVNSIFLFIDHWCPFSSVILFRRHFSLLLHDGSVPKEVQDFILQLRMSKWEKKKNANELLVVQTVHPSHHYRLKNSPWLLPN